MTDQKRKFKAKGMHCTSCETLIEKTLKKVDGVTSVKVDYPTETVEVEYNEDKTNLNQLATVVEQKGYDCSECKTDKETKENSKTKNLSEESENDSDYYNINTKLIGIILGVIGILVIGYFAFGAIEGIKIPEISQNMGYGLLFVVGLLTGFHCISMCGGFVVSYTAKHAQEGTKSHRSHLMYATGKVISYTIIGAAFGLLGSIIAFTPMIRGVAGVLAGTFLVIFGLNMLNIFPWLRKIRIKAPQSVNSFVSKESSEHKSPLIIGLLNGLMIACGPLQAIYIMAAGTGSAIEGAKLLFVFALGTLPVMLGFGLLTSIISAKATHKILKASGAIVIVLGLIMINRGLVLTGTGFDTSSIITSVAAGSGTSNTPGNTIALEDGYQIIRMDVMKYGWEPNTFVLKKGVPVKWIINGKDITGCNNAIQVPAYNLNFDIKPGEQTIEFTPDKEGTIRWSCWMGMISGTFIVKENIDPNDQAAVQKELDSEPQQPVGVCGGGAGGAGCGSPTCGSTTGSGGCGCGG